MNTQPNDMFCLNNSLKKDIRYVRLTKKASYREEELRNLYYGEDDWRKTEFYSLGFYDSLTCFAPSEDSLTYKEHFWIDYPIKKTVETLKVEQWFGLFPLSDQSIYHSNEAYKDEEPFFCSENLKEELPFIGVILISLSNLNVEFKKLLIKYIDIIGNILKNVNEEYIAKIYYSLNCADLCLVIRTDTLPDIHKINREIIAASHEDKDEVNTTVIFSVQSTAKNFSEKIKQKNANVSFIVRSNIPYKPNPCTAHTSYGVNGIGKYVTKMSFDEYTTLLPEISNYKNGNMETSGLEEDKTLFARSICHEREWFQEDSESLPSVALPSEEKENVIKGCIASYFRKIQSIEEEINRKDGIFAYEYGTHQYKELFERELRLIRDLVFTYSDLWYQNSSESGFVFCIQLWIALTGIENYVEKLKDYIEDRNKLIESIDGLISVTHDIACDLNGYNKQFQYLNQDSVNFPSYEIQSKINAEKYMSAYCSFLYEFFSLYYNAKDETEYICQTFPIAMVDIDQRKIIAKIFFQNVYTYNTKIENNQNRSLFAVHFPSAEYFANLWSSVPLLMHEVSHINHYGETVDRNNAIIYSLEQFFAETIVSKLLCVVNDGIIINTSSVLTEALKEAVGDSIKEVCTKYFEKLGDMEKWKFIELRQNCRLFYNSIFQNYNNAKSITYNEFNTFKQHVTNDIQYILDIFDYNGLGICDITTESSFPIEMQCFLDAMFLRFCEKADNINSNKGLRKSCLNGIIQTFKAKYDSKGNTDNRLLRASIYILLEVDINDSYMRRELDDLYGSICEHNAIDDIIYALTHLLIAAMMSAFGKHNVELNEKLNIQDYCTNIIPRLHDGNIGQFTDMLNKQYQKYIDDNKYKGEIFHGKNIIKSLFAEYQEIYMCINNTAKFLCDGDFEGHRGSYGNQEELIKAIHKKCREYIQQMEDDENDANLIFTRSNRRKLTRLGFFNTNIDIISKVFSDMVYGLGDAFVDKSISDRIELFREVYADCGMCMAIGFDTFGYCMFALAIHNSVGDLTASDRKASFLADRIRSVLKIYFPDNKKEQWGETFSAFYSKLFDKEMVADICQLLRNDTDDEKILNKVEQTSADFKIASDKPVSKRHLSVWRSDIIGKLISVMESKGKSQKKKLRWEVAKMYLHTLYSVIELFLEEDVLNQINHDIFNGYFSKISGLMAEETVIKYVRENSCVRSIAEFYNMPYKGNKLDSYYKTYSDGFIEQCNFVFQNYCNYKDAYSKLIKGLIDDNITNISGEWFKYIEEYYEGGAA